MNSESKKVIAWDKPDYIKTILLFVFNALVIAGIFVFTVYFNDKSGFAAYFKTNGTKFLYLCATMFFVVAVLYLYFYFEHRNFIKKLKNIVLVFAITDINIIISYFIGIYIDVYARPIALGTLLALTLIGRKEAVFINISQCLLLFLMDTFTNADYGYANANYSSLMIGFTAGMIAIYIVDGIKSRLKVFLTGFIIAVPIIFIAAFLEIGRPNRLWVSALLGLNAGVLSVILFMAILPLFEYLFGAVTDYRLYELTDHDSKLIKRLIAEAPGTFNHSIIVSNLAEACAIAIGENSQFARAAAYYHDIGKLKNPGYFGENFTGGGNPHDEFTPELSTDIIRAHAKDGYDLVIRSGLPEELADICLQHHGTMPIKYFYAKAKKFTEGSLNVDEFSYSGPKPRTKTAAIIMLADACEAKVRTLSNRATENVDKCVLSIIEERMDAEQFNECEITLLELDIIRKAIVTSLTGIYHDRVKYPRMKIKKENKEVKDEPS